MRSESLRSARELAGQAALVARDSGAAERGQVPRRPPTKMPILSRVGFFVGKHYDSTRRSFEVLY